jgi:glycosyltransferase involved in cell wall biosynthesis
MSVYKNDNPVDFKNALTSISINQTLKPTEIILVVDGPVTSEINKIILDFESLNVYRLDKNFGLGYALNFGLSKTNYELIARMDSDDIAHPQRFEKQLPIIQKEDIAILGSNIEEFNYEIGDLKQFRNVPSDFQQINKLKMSRNPFNHMTVIFKKTIVAKVGGYKDMPGYEDYYLWMRLLLDHKGMNLNENLVYARVGNNMFGRRQGIAFLVKEIKFQKTLFAEKLINKNQFYKNIIFRGMIRLFPKSILSLFYRSFLRN